MNGNDKAVRRLIGRVYDAALEPAAWQPFLRDAADVFASSCATLLVHDVETLRGSFQASIGLDRVWFSS